MECFPNTHWKTEDFLADDTMIAEVDAQIAGFLVSKQVFAGDSATPSEREILNIAVRPTFRRLGIASALLKQELSRRATYFLEVRESNVAAQTLYRNFGFLEVARRPGYYNFPVRMK